MMATFETIAWLARVLGLVDGKGLPRECLKLALGVVYEMPYGEEREVAVITEWRSNIVWDAMRELTEATRR